MSKDFFDKFKNILGDCIEFVIEKKRYVVSGLMMGTIVLVLASSDGKKLRFFPEFKNKNKPVEAVKPVVTEPVEEEEKDTNPLILNEDKELNKFIKNYYKALEKADIEKIRKYVDVLSDVEVASIRQKSISREAHKNIKVYTKKGPEDDSYLAYVYLDLKFKNIKTMAPGIEPFYIKKESDGYVIINSMNSSAEDLQYTNDIESAEDVVELFAKTDDAYREACAKDKELVKMLKDNGFSVPDFNKDDEKSTADNKDAENKNNENKDKDNKSSESETGTNTENKENNTASSGSNNNNENNTVNTENNSSQDTTTANNDSNKDKDKKPNKNSKSILGKTYVLTDNVRVRSKKTTKSSVKASGIKDDRVRVVKEYEGSQWIKVQLIAAGKGYYGYMKKDVLLANSKIKK